ncbi:MAG TPA: hypothetical protein VG501_08325, partial [Rhizomicrobium sp.]|nr:hypothetical protein [Rhizomicrobium sp.]
IFRAFDYGKSPGVLMPPLPDRERRAIEIAPPRLFTPMRAQPVIPWTLARLLSAGLAWLLTPTPVPLAPAGITTVKAVHRRSVAGQG